MKENKNLDSMHFGADAFSFKMAELLRQNMTLAEKILWEELKGKKLDGLKFRRQHSIGRFIVDFYCHQYRLVIELDGKIHLKTVIKLNDLNREEELKEHELKILRFENDEILNELPIVLDKIRLFIKENCLLLL